MAAAYGPNYTPSWGVGLLFVGFLILTLIWEKLLHATEHALKKRNKPGLLKVLHTLLEEILAVGLIVLLLPLFEKHLQNICVPMKWYNKAPGYTEGSWLPKTADDAGSSPKYVAAAAYPYNSSSNAGGGSGYPAKTTTTGSYPANYTSGSSNYGGRHLLAPSGSPDKAKCPDGSYKGDVCSCGYTQLYPLDAIHGVHIFIALTAIVHIIYAGISMLLCLWRVKRWRRWEAAAVESPLICIGPTIIRSLGRSSCMHAVTAMVNQFWLPVSQLVYAALRRLMLEQLKQHAGTGVLPIDFPFIDYVKEAMEHSFCHVVGVSPMVWAFAVLQLIVPVQWRVWCIVLLCGITVILMVIAGAKLHSVVVHLAARAFFLYGEDSLQEHAAIAIDNQKCNKLPSSLDTEVLNSNSIRDQAGVKPSRVAAAAGGALPKVMEWTGDDKTANPMLVQMKHKKLPANFVTKFNSYCVRAKTDDDLPSIFWFHNPRLLLWFYKLAYFQSSFCVTLVLFAFWKSNQFLPPKENKVQLYAFAIAFGLNVLLSLFQSTCVLPVYALVSITDRKSLPAAGKFLERTLRYEEEAHAAAGEKDAAAALEAAQHQQMREVLQKLSSHIKHMTSLAEQAEGRTNYRSGKDSMRGLVEELSV